MKKKKEESRRVSGGAFKAPWGDVANKNTHTHSNACAQQVGHICLRRQMLMSHQTRLSPINTSHKFRKEAKGPQ